MGLGIRKWLYEIRYKPVEKTEVFMPLHPLSKIGAKKYAKSYSFWYQRIHLGNNVYTMKIGPAFHELVWNVFKNIFPNDLRGATVLDIGTNAGYFPIALKSSNAGRVVGLEFVDTFLKQAKEINKIYGYKDVEYLNLDAHGVSKLKGNFDIVVFTGILYHLKNPLQVVEDVANKCKDVILVETEAIPIKPGGYIWARQGCPSKLSKCKYGYMKFIEGDSLNDDITNWWIPDAECLMGMLRTAGFKYFSRPYFLDKTRLIVAASKKRNSLADLSKL